MPGRSAVGGGSLPGETLPTHLVTLAADSPDAVAARLRAGEPPVITRIEDDRLVLDPRTVLPEQEQRYCRWWQCHSASHGLMRLVNPLTAGDASTHPALLRPRQETA